jgi:hypothetical protein
MLVEYFIVFSDSPDLSEGRRISMKKKKMYQVTFNKSKRVYEGEGKVFQRFYLFLGFKAGEKVYFCD